MWVIPSLFAQEQDICKKRNPVYQLCMVYYVVFLTFFLGLKTASRQAGSFMIWNWHGSEIIQ